MLIMTQHRRQTIFEQTEMSAIAKSHEKNVISSWLTHLDQSAQSRRCPVLAYRILNASTSSTMVASISFSNFFKFVMVYCKGPFVSLMVPLRFILLFLHLQQRQLFCVSWHAPHAVASGKVVVSLLRLLACMCLSYLPFDGKFRAGT